MGGAFSICFRQFLVEQSAVVFDLCCVLQRSKHPLSCNGIVVGIELCGISIVVLQCRCIVLMRHLYHVHPILTVDQLSGLSKSNSKSRTYNSRLGSGIGAVAISI